MKIVTIPDSSVSWRYGLYDRRFDLQQR